MFTENPSNIDLLFATKEDIEGMRPITVLDIMEGLTKNFHPNGLFSTEIFGKVGGEFRNRLFSYIDLRVPIVHPNIYKVIVKLKSLYEEIILGKSFAIFNPKTGDFEKSSALLGETGFDFFLTNWPKVKLDGRDSSSRKEAIKLLNKYKDNIFIDKLIVLPAGLRDYFVDESGKPGEDEINEYYRNIMRTSFSMETISVRDSLGELDSIRANLQTQVVALYNYVIDLLSGKRGAIQARWTTRAIINSTRNVITSYIPRVTELGGPQSVSPNQSVIGLYQFLRAFIPLAVKEVREKFSQRVFPSQNAAAALINKKTLKREQVAVSSKHLDRWLTYEGIEKTFASFGNQDLRHSVLEIDGYYMALIYRRGNMFKMIFDIDEIPEDLREGADIKPITLTEMLYICTYEMSKNQMGFVTRYPVAGYGGIYPSEVYLRTTMDTEILVELDDFWQPKPDKVCEFPVRGDKFMDSMAPAACHLLAMGADFDGDKTSFTGVWTDEAKEELRELLANWSFYISASGKMAFSMNDDIISIILSSMTKRIT